MTDLSPDARRLLGLARRGDDPCPADRERVNQRMAKRLALAAGVAGTTLGTAKVASGAGAVSLLLAKGLVTGVVMTATAVGAWKVADRVISQRHAADTAVTRAARPSAGSNPAFASKIAPLASGTESPMASAVAIATSVAVPSDLPVSGNEPAIGAAAALPELVRARSRDSSTTDRTKPTRAIDGAAETSSARPLPNDPGGAITTDPLLAEAAALRQAQGALNAGRPEHALAMIREQDTRFAGGALNQERAAAEVFALCSLGRVADARRLAARFEERWPRSPMLARVRRACEPAREIP